MDVGRIEAVLTARFDNDPFDKYDRALRDARQESGRTVEATLKGDFDGSGFSKFDRELEGAQREARQGATARLDAKADTVAMDRYRRSLNDVDGTTRRATQSTGGLKSSFTTLAGNAKMLAGGAAIAAVALSARAMYEEMSEAETVGAQLDAVLKSTGGSANVTKAQVLALSEAVGRKAALDDEAVASGANLLLTFTKVRNEAGKGNDVFSRAVGMTADLSRSFGKDLNMSAIMLGKALNDPIAGVSALSRVGVQFTDDQKATIEALVESGNVLGAQKLILAELETQVGGSAEAYGKTLPGAVDRARNAFNNLMEDLGGKIAPAINVAAGALEDLFTGKAFKGGGTLDKVFGPLTDAVGKVYEAWLPVFGRIKDAFNDVFSGDTGKQTLDVLNKLRDAMVWAFGGIADVIQRVVPGVEQMFRGLFTVVRGFVRIISGLLSGDFGRVWAGLKDIVGGALTAVWGAIRVATAPIRAALAAVFRPIGSVIRTAFNAAKSVVEAGVRVWLTLVRAAIAPARAAVRAVFAAAPGIFRTVWNTVRGIVQTGARAVTTVVRGVTGAARSAARAVGNALTEPFDVVRNVPGKVRDAIGDAISGVRNLAGRALSAGASVGRAVINGIGQGLSAAAGFLSSIGRGIADWINANTPFGDRIDIGPVSVSLPALAEGGRVGPSLKGARVFIAGEGSKDEWVISQEGNRQKNVGWAVEALETLTGKTVGLFKGGKGAKGVKRAEKRLRNISGAGWAGYVTKTTNEIGREERRYGQLERQLAMSEEEYFTENADGSVVVNWTMVNQRIGEIDQLMKARQRIINMIQGLIDWIRKTKKPLSKTIAALRKAGKPGKNDSDDAQRRKQAYRDKADNYNTILNEMLAADPDLVLDKEDSALDKLELQTEKTSLSEQELSSGTRPADPPDTPDSPDSPGTPGATPPSPEEIARAAAAEVAELMSNRSALFASFGQNFIGAGAAQTAMTAMAGARFFGAGQTDPGILGASGGGGAYGTGVGVDERAGRGITITNNYAAPPPDPHTWSQSLAWEMRTAVS